MGGRFFLTWYLDHEFSSPDGTWRFTNEYNGYVSEVRYNTVSKYWSNPIFWTNTFSFRGGFVATHDNLGAEMRAVLDGPMSFINMHYNVQYPENNYGTPFILKLQNDDWLHAQVNNVEVVWPGHDNELIRGRV